MLKKTSLRGICFMLLGILLVGTIGSAGASTLVPQTALPGDCVPQFAVPLPVFGPAGGIPRVNARQHPFLTVKMKETDQAVLPQGGTDICGLGVVFKPTRVWAYEISDTFSSKVLGPAHWPAVTVEAARSVPAVVKYVNELPSFNPSNVFGPPFGPGLVQGLLSTDQTIHWADPPGLGCVMRLPPVNCTLTPGDPCCQTFTGTPPTVPHLHGAEVPSSFDGGPEAWFTSDGQQGQAYRTLGHPGPGKAIYKYNNSQEPGTLWFHDHALGATRTNVYSGLAAFYFLRAPLNEPRNLPSGPHEIEMAIQDRQFDINSQLFFPDGSGADAATSNLNGTPPNPDIHPFWNPEFIGDVVVVNGAPWPFLNVEPRRYRFRLLDGSNARVYRLSFGAAPVYQIGADDNYLNAPALVDQVFIAPGERADVIVDFSKLAGQSVTVTNDAPVPFPDGLVPGVDQPGMANIMQFRVSSVAVRDTSCNPAVGQCRRPTLIPRLTDGRGGVAHGVKIDKVRQLVLKEFEGPGGPVEVMVNNTEFDGTKSPSIAADFPNGVSEQPRVGSTELWEIINLTGDAHPIHTHLAQYQILNRQAYDADGTLGSGIPGGYIGVDDGAGGFAPAGAWTAAFGTGPAPLPAGCVAGQFCPSYGPPLPYGTPNADGAIGGNPAIGPYLLGLPASPAPAESGWKDTAKANPGEVLRLLVRWAPTSTPVNRSHAGLNLYPFDPTQGPGYVWHCHILDHEDNEMMRPYLVVK
jgi:spore coat protein A